MPVSTLLLYVRLDSLLKMKNDESLSAVIIITTPQVVNLYLVPMFLLAKPLLSRIPHAPTRQLAP